MTMTMATFDQSDDTTSSWNHPFILVGIVVVLVELCFYLYFRLYMLPFANQRIPHGNYKHYGNHRHKYFVRIMDRIIRRSKTTKTHPLYNCIMYYLQWYDYVPPENNPDNDVAVLKPIEIQPQDFAVTSKDDSDTDSENSDDYDKYWNLVQQFLNVIKRDDADKFICWALFGKHKHELEDWEMKELDKAHEKGEDTFGFDTKPGSAGVYQPKVLLSLEDCGAYHHPLMFYGAMEVCRQLGYCAFQLFGFQLFVASNGLRCWYKPGNDDCDLLPALLFQGVAPGGPALFLPLILTTLARDGRAVFLFECEAVSCTLRFDSVMSEDETIAGVVEAVEKFVSPQKDLCVVGHSFGSCQLTWVLHAQLLRNRIKQFVLLEPTSLMLSESDVILNMHKFYLKLCVDIVMEWYIRRKFEWYNSELWLDDIPADCQVLVVLGGKDFIVNSTKIRDEIKSFSIVHPEFAKRTKLIDIDHATHGNCLVNPYTWMDIREAMLRQHMALYPKKKMNKKKLE